MEEKEGKGTLFLRPMQSSYIKVLAIIALIGALGYPTSERDSLKVLYHFEDAIMGDA